ncbi:MAG: hypothetical protein R2755_00345 [Acidimicrobiales bacterium]
MPPPWSPPICTPATSAWCAATGWSSSRFDGAGARAATAAQKAAAKAATAATTDRQDAELELARIEARLDAERPARRTG